MATALVRRHNENLLETLEEGDMIEFPRAKGIYSHWAVYTGKGKVIHLAPDPNSTSSATSSDVNIFFISGELSKKAKVREDNLIEVAANSKARKNNNKDQKATPSDPKEIIKRARSKLGDIGYNILWQNCECFASWCRYGDGWSEQTINALIAAGLLAAAAIVGGAVAVAKAVGGEEKEKKDVLPK